MESKLTLFQCSMEGVSQRADKHEDKEELGLMGYTFASTTIPHQHLYLYQHFKNPFS